MGLYNNYAGALRVCLFIGPRPCCSATACFESGALEFGRVVGLYIATLFVVWQVINYLAFRTLPSLPILVGGAFHSYRGAIATFGDELVRLAGPSRACLRRVPAPRPVHLTKRARTRAPHHEPDRMNALSF